MSRVRGKDTGPEMAVRRLVHALGYRYRLHVRELPGCPDLVFPGRKKVIFVHGCFWHRHRCRHGRQMPKTRPEFWRPKLEGNRERDRSYRRALTRQGWGVLVVWQCQTRRLERLTQRLIAFLERPPRKRKRGHSAFSAGRHLQVT